ncbi:hypothetical protein ROZALSC1DRAFT_23602 [Rozella allomycis CSF55]|uniref:Uncharacterized protein n=1 Tax=Rozella allomycis (strain CSF55) TaxID=988480 RepID=A0A4P9YEX1_ROZAC|nr:hypothetical protein ROZALSC1DRAFT_23602 [Rozella allomycis CSF55]
MALSKLDGNFYHIRNLLETWDTHLTIDDIERRLLNERISQVCHPNLKRSTTKKKSHSQRCRCAEYCAHMICFVASLKDMGLHGSVLKERQVKTKYNLHVANVRINCTQNGWVIGAHVFEHNHPPLKEVNVDVLNKSASEAYMSFLCELRVWFEYSFDKNFIVAGRLCDAGSIAILNEKRCYVLKTKDEIIGAIGNIIDSSSSQNLLILQGYRSSSDSLYRIDLPLVHGETYSAYTSHQPNKLTLSELQYRFRLKDITPRVLAHPIGETKYAWLNGMARWTDGNNILYMHYMRHNLSVYRLPGSPDFLNFVEPTKFPSTHPPNGNRHFETTQTESKQNHRINRCFTTITILTLKLLKIYDNVSTECEEDSFSYNRKQQAERLRWISFINQARYSEVKHAAVEHVLSLTDMNLQIADVHPAY